MGRPIVLAVTGRPSTTQPESLVGGDVVIGGDGA
jgi:hypothetical protein